MAESKKNHHAQQIRFFAHINHHSHSLCTASTTPIPTVLCLYRARSIFILHDESINPPTSAHYLHEAVVSQWPSRGEILTAFLSWLIGKCSKNVSIWLNLCLTLHSGHSISANGRMDTALHRREEKNPKILPPILSPPPNAIFLLDRAINSYCRPRRI